MSSQALGRIYSAQSAVTFRLQPSRKLAAGVRSKGVAPTSRRCARQLHQAVRAYRSDRDEYDCEDVVFDDEEDWEQRGTNVQPSFGPFLSTALRGLQAVSSRLADAALQVAPANTSPEVVRVAVNAGMVLLALSFIKSLLSFFLTLGSIVLGAYVAVRVFGLDVPGVSTPGGGSSGRAGPRQQQQRQQQRRRRQDPRARQSEFKGLLGSGEPGDDGLLDVWFERKPPRDANNKRSSGRSRGR